MRRLIFVLAIFTFSTGVFAATTPASLGDLLQQAWQCERADKIDDSLTAYLLILKDRPDDLQINLKIAQLLVGLDKGKAAAPYLVKCLDIMQAHPASSPGLQITVCRALMGSRPAEWRGRSYSSYIAPVPFTTLPDNEQQRIRKLLPVLMTFQTQYAEACFRFSNGEVDLGLQLMKKMALSGNWQDLRSLRSQIPAARLLELIKSWSLEAKNTGNAALWLGVMSLQDPASFKKSFPDALASLKKTPALLQSLGNLCAQNQWKEGEEKVRSMPGGVPAKSQKDQLFADLDKALDAADKAKTIAKLRSVASDYPTYLADAFYSERIKKMQALDWQDLLVDYIQPEMLEHLGWSSEAALITGSVYNQPRFDFWIKRMLSYYSADDHFCVFLTDAAEYESPEKAVWLMEQSLRVFPKNRRLLMILAKNYNSAGYADKALPVLLQLISDTDQKRAIAVSEPVRLMWSICKRSGKLDATLSEIWNKRASLQPSVLLAISRMFYEENKMSEAQKWVDEAGQDRGVVDQPDKNDSMNSMVYFKRELYEARLNILIKSGKLDDAKKVLAEAKAAFKDFNYVDRVSGIGVVADADFDWNAEIQRQTKALKVQIKPSTEVIPYYPFVKLARAIAKAGKADEAKALAEELMPAQKQWQDGFVLCVAMFRDRVPGIVPFIDWLKSISSTKDYAGASGGRGIAAEFMSAIADVDPTLNVLYGNALIMTAPEDEYGNNLTNIFIYGGPPKPDESAQLGKELASKKLSRTAMTKFVRGFSSQSAVWMKEAINGQTWCAAGLLLNIFIGADTLSEEKLQALLTSLAAQEDWKYIDRDLFLSCTGLLAERKLIPQAKELINLGLKYLPKNQTAALASQLAKISGKAPNEPTGEDAKQCASWISYAMVLQAMKSAGAREATLKALELASTANERLQAIYLLIGVDPAPFDQMLKQFPKFLVDGEGLSGFGSALFMVVAKDHSLAAKAVPLLDQISAPGFDFDQIKRRALVNIWAGNTEKGVGILFPSGVLGHVNVLGEMAALVVSNNLPAEARAVVAARLEREVLASEISVSDMASAIGYSLSDSSKSSDGTTALGKVIVSCVKAAKGIVPVSIIGACINALKESNVFHQKDSAMTDAWWVTTEAVTKIAAQTAGNSAVAEYLQSRLNDLKSSSFSTSQSYAKLKSLADSLK